METAKFMYINARIKHKHMPHLFHPVSKCNVIESTRCGVHQTTLKERKLKDKHNEWKKLRDGQKHTCRNRKTQKKSEGQQRKECQGPFSHLHSHHNKKRALRDMNTRECTYIEMGDAFGDGRMWKDSYFPVKKGIQRVKLSQNITVVYHCDLQGKGKRIPRLGLRNNNRDGQSSKQHTDCHSFCILSEYLIHELKSCVFGWKCWF